MIKLDLNDHNRDELIQNSKFIKFLESEIFSNCRIYDIIIQLNDNINCYKKFQFEESEFMYKYNELNNKLEIDIDNIDIKFALFKDINGTLDDYHGDYIGYSFATISVPVYVIESESIEEFNKWVNKIANDSLIQINNQIELLKNEYNRILNACSDPT